MGKVDFKSLNKSIEEKKKIIKTGRVVIKPGQENKERHESINS